MYHGPCPARPAYCAAIERAARRRYPARLVVVGTTHAIATMMVESGGDPRAKNPTSSACGLFQTVKAAREHVGIDDCFDPHDSIRGGVRYLAWCTVMWSRSNDPRPRTDPELVEVGSGCYHNGPGWMVSTQRRTGARYWHGEAGFAASSDEAGRVYVERIEAWIAKL